MCPEILTKFVKQHNRNQSRIIEISPVKNFSIQNADVTRMIADVTEIIYSSKSPEAFVITNVSGNINKFKNEQY